MTPKEKAEELFLKCPIVELGDDKGIVKNELSINALKNVLLFMIDQILKEESIGSLLIDWWKEVKQEIEKL